MGLNNIEIFYGDVYNFEKPFDVALAVHACGYLTDIVQDKALNHNASYLLVPCCFGKMATHKDLEYPRSDRFKALLSTQEYFRLARLADLNTTVKGNTQYYTKTRLYIRELLQRKRMYGIY